MNKRILILSNSVDIHADIVESKLKLNGGCPFRINLDDFPKHFSINAGAGRNGLSCRLEHMPSGDVLDFSDIGAVWTRKPADFSFESDLSAQEAAFAQSETEHLMFSLLYSLDCYWMSHPLASRGALWKGEQLQRAARMGFLVPRSIITNAPEAVRRFRSEVGGDIVIKAMSSPSLCAQDVRPEEREREGLPTTRVTDEHLQMLDAVRQLPCLFQEYVAKKHELRVTVIGDRIFAARIHSQEDARTATDYRDFSAEIPYAAETLPEELAKRCLDFVHSYGLQFGALDLIVTPDDDIVFLENNPAGQFLFVEQLVPTLKMTDAMAEVLMTHAQATARSPVAC